MNDEWELEPVSETLRGLPVKDPGIIDSLLDGGPEIGFNTLENGQGASTGSIEQV
jgi:hypothetical protein